MVCSAFFRRSSVSIQFSNPVNLHIGTAWSGCLYFSHLASSHTSQPCGAAALFELSAVARAGMFTDWLTNMSGGVTGKRTIINIQGEGWRLHVWFGILQETQQSFQTYHDYVEHVRFSSALFSFINEGW